MTEISRIVCKCRSNETPFKWLYACTGGYTLQSGSYVLSFCFVITLYIIKEISITNNYSFSNKFEQNHIKSCLYSIYTKICDINVGQYHQRTGIISQYLPSKYRVEINHALCRTFRTTTRVYIIDCLINIISQL